ncbi:MAG TPA: Rad52/Rad22 family DNA repair protein [Gemmatimonadaceae bacterium]|nr:Rad52/Rad22 family DNA repair protein [Gemmatimonadaceae bacterium]
MIARHEVQLDKMDIWAQLSAPLPTTDISWRQDGRAIQRDGRHYARFVAYVDANTVRERLDSVVPGEWDLTLELLPPLPTEDGEQNCSFKARLQILGVIREDVGTGRDYKSAATDAFKRAGVRFGIAHELYAFEQNWVQVDSDSRFAKPVEDPALAYARRTGTRTGRVADGRTERTEAVVLEMPAVEPGNAPATPQGAPATLGPLATGEPECPKCGGRMWDNRISKRNPKAPDFKCRDRSCDGVIWPDKKGARDEASDSKTPATPSSSGAGPLVPEAEEELPF